jgi:signal transduction histidine kinase
LFLVILGPSLLLLVLIYQDYRNLSELGQSAELILAKNYRSIKAARHIRQKQEMVQDRVLTVLFREGPGQAASEIDPEIDELLEMLRSNITEPGEAEIIQRIYEVHDRYRAVPNESASTVGASPSVDRRLRFISLHAEMGALLNDLVGVNEEAMEKAERRTKAVAGRAMRYSVGLLVSAILFTVILSYVLSSRISKPLRLLTRTLSDLKEGSGDYPALPVATNDEIGFLIREFNRLFERLKVYDRVSAGMLSAERLKVRQAEEAKARFIADLSHQLKTPMTSLSMSVGTLSERGARLASETRAKLVETALDDCRRLSVLINELVDVSRLEGGIELRKKELLDVETVLRECLRPLERQAAERGVRLETEVEPGLPPAPIDSLRFPWVVTNLAGNALRYTDRGGRVTIRARRQGPRLVFQCADTGAGIDPKYLPMIFERYTQFSEREKSGAIGLGLAIVQEIIEQHGGGIEVESELGRGTVFTFWIPL